MITYTLEQNLSSEAFREILINSGLGARRPVDDPERLRAMITNANLVLTARDAGKLIGIARSVTDFVYCTYLSDLAVHQSHQGKGIGTELIRQTKLKTPKAKLILLSAPAAIAYYPKIGMDRHDFCYYLDDVQQLK
ncbi:GNAT family N-acetyltransferase [Robiginitalea sp.]|jgi:predicted N-acetyltransferase YhbS|uniref:GNAT family N-acetyltransferase n=1 Tax=Robiginitalea sp. TaxID=1902411 RepID=UPI003C756C70